MEESIAGKLRAARVDHTDQCFGELMGGVLGEEVACPPALERLQCDACYEICLRKLADEIEAEQADLLERYENALAEQERAKAEHGGVDVAALLKVADRLDSVSNFGERDPKWIFRQALCDWAASIRDAVKGANPSKSRGLSGSKPMPSDADDEPCFLGDAVWHEGRKHLVVAVSHKGKVCIRAWETRNSGEGAIWVPAKYVTHRKPDTQGSIENDATMPPRIYCATKLGHDVGLKDDAECTEAMIRDLLRRQRELMGGEQ